MNEENKQDIKKIEIRQSEMPSSAKTSFTTSRAMGNSITDILKEVSDDVVACVIYTQPKIGVQANLILADVRKHDKDKVKFVLPYKTEESKKTILDRMTEQRRADSTRYLALTDEAKVKLAEFVPDFLIVNNHPVFNFDPKNKEKVYWDRCSKEFVEMASNSFGETRLYIKVQFDLNKWLKKIYGAKGTNGEAYEYVVSAMHPENPGRYPYIGQANISYVLSYTQYNAEELKRAAQVTSGVNPDAFYGSFCSF